MTLFSFRMKDGNSVIIYAKDEDSAAKILGEMGVQSSAATVREIKRFVASFALSDTGDLHTTLLDPGTLNQVAPDYPLLASARAHSYADFGSSRPGTLSEPALFNDATRQHDRNWDRRDKDVIACAVQQERERFSN
jgi:hypothetical protein